MPAPSKGTYSCPTCGNTYQRKNHLVRHQATHNTASSHKCQACRKRFSRSDLLRKHYSHCSKKQQDRELPRLSRGPRRKACDYCFRSKVSCDRGTPCRHCRLRELQCTYSRLHSQADGPSATKAPAGPNVDFFLNITNPVAANMWRSFSDDDTPALRPPVADLELFADTEWECFPRLGGPMFDLVQEDMKDDYIPIFKPEARTILKEKCASATQDLQAVHTSLSNSDPSYDGVFNSATAEEALSPDSTIRFAGGFFRRYHHIPVINRHSFGLPDTSVALLLAVSLAGALQSPPQDDALALVSLTRLIEEYTVLQLAKAMSTRLSSQSSTASIYRLEIVQAAVLMSNVLLLVNNVSTRKRVRMRLQPALVSAVRQLGLFSSRHSTFVNEAQYIKEEICIRIAHWTAVGDWYHSIMFNLPPLTTTAEMTGDMPDATGVWGAENALGSSSRRKQGTPKVQQLCSVTEILRALTQDEFFDPSSSGLSSLSILNLHFLILAIFSMLVSTNLTGIISIVAPSMEKALSRWHEIWEIALSNTPGDILTTSGIEQYSEEQYWAARRMLEAMISRDGAHPYLRRVGHDSLVEFHAFLVQSQKTNH
ncbi:hypothetical protein CC79DRAFT_1361493 [Sarocladium strictum]